jgi:hypothetical protein
MTCVITKPYPICAQRWIKQKPTDRVPMRHARRARVAGGHFGSELIAIAVSRKKLRAAERRARVSTCLRHGLV